MTDFFLIFLFSLPENHSPWEGIALPHSWQHRKCTCRPGRLEFSLVCVSVVHAGRLFSNRVWRGRRICLGLECSKHCGYGEPALVFVEGVLGWVVVMLD